MDKCQNCKYCVTNPYSINNEWRLCFLSKNPNPKLMKSGCGLQTNKEFYCICFELKKQNG